MKKILLYTFILAATALMATSCSKEKAGSTATVALAGEWLVQVDVIDDDGTVYEDPFGMGELLVITNNTNDNAPNKIWVNDLKGFWNFKVEVPANTGSLTFGGPDEYFNYGYSQAEIDAYGECLVSLWDGKIVYGGAVSPLGYTTDAIEFKVKFSDDASQYTYWLHGWRRTGFQQGAD